MLIMYQRYVYNSRELALQCQEKMLTKTGLYVYNVSVEVIYL